MPHPLVDKDKRNLVMDLTVKHERFGSSMKVTNGTLCVRLANRDRPIEQEAREKIAKHRNLYNLLPGDIGFLPLVVSTSGRLNADFIRLCTPRRRPKNISMTSTQSMRRLDTRRTLLGVDAIATSSSSDPASPRCCIVTA